MIKHELLDNIEDSFIVIETKKQQPVFFPKEESQMFQSRNFSYISSPDTEDESENTDKLAFDQRESILFERINSSHTPTDYIGAVNVSVPYQIKDTFCDFKIYDLKKGILRNLYEDSDTIQKIKQVLNGVQTLRIPKNVFNTLIDTTNEDAIINNGGSGIIKNYGKYYISIKPKYIQTYISTVILKQHYTWEDMISNNDGTDAPNGKRRNIYECDKDDFKSLAWDFEAYPEQSGRLFGSIVEIWDAAGTELKQVKGMMENIFNFNENENMKFSLSPDNMGYDSPLQNISVGDMIRIYPRETFFDEILLELDYKDKYLQLENMISFMINDVARDMLTGSYQVYDEKGLKVDTQGIVTGNVLHKYQITQTDRHELRKRIKS